MPALPRSRLGVFAKYWQPGQVKTRLAASIGEAAAANLHFRFVQVILERLSSFPATRSLLFTPPDRQNEFERIAGDDWSVEPQAEGDLGQRMASFFQSSFDRGFERVVLIGSDSPTIPVEFIVDAFERLSDATVVIGPSDDGGYYLIGAAEKVPPIFTDIDWGTRQVFKQTLMKLTSKRVPVAQLPPWYDVDEIADLERLHQELQTADGALANRELASAVQEALERRQ